MSALHLLGVVLHRQGSSREAIPYLERAVALDANDAELRLHLGSALHSAGYLARAECEMLAAVRLNPRSAAAYCGLGNLYKQLARVPEAVQSLRSAVAADPHLVEVWHNLGSALRDAGDERAAIEAFDRAIELEPGTVESRLSRALALLGSGDLARGWEAHEDRMRVPRIARNVRPFTLPVWNGDDLGGRGLLVYAEQGIGDEILFASLLPEISQRAGRCVLECSGKLVKLFARSFPRVEVVARREPVDERCVRDLHRQIAMGSLGRWLRPSVDDFPRSGGYLVADTQRVQYWRSRLGALGAGLKVGFSWRSSNMTGERELSCTQLDQWEELFAVDGVRWICLQYDDCEGDLERARARFSVPLHRYPEVDYFDDLDEVAALMSALDLVITAPTSVCVQAAAQGVPTWQLSYGADWQTMGTDRTPWLPELVRYQRRWDQSWEEIFSVVARDLRARSRGSLANPVQSAPGTPMLENCAHESIRDPAAFVKSMPAPETPPDSFAAQIARAQLAFERGALDEAAAAYRAALRDAPDQPEVCVNLATALARAGRQREAIEVLAAPCLQATISAGTLTAAAMVCEGIGEVERAERFYRRALAVDSSHVKALAQLGTLVLSRRAFAEAADLLTRASVQTPANWKLCCHLGHALLGAGQAGPAAQAFATAAALAPDEAITHAGRADALRTLGDLGAAVDAYERAIELSAADPGIRHRHGVTLFRLERLDEAITAQRSALAINPSLHAARMSLNRALHERGDAREAIAGYRAMIADDPNDGWAHWNLAHALLCSGDLEHGWDEYEWRFDPNVGIATRRGFPEPIWQGEPLDARTIVVCREQGIGDQIVFASMIPDLFERGAHVVIECTPKLVPLFARSFEADVVPKTDPPNPLATLGIDYQIPAGSLARQLRRSVADFPQRRAFLRADEQRVAYWRERLARGESRPIIGFSWRSHNLEGDRALKCSPIEAWAPLLATREARFVCLQYDECAQELECVARLTGARVQRLEDVDMFDDLEETAAVISAVDLVISAPTTVAALSAALGIETWQVTQGSDWQMLGQDCNLWLPAMRRMRRDWGEPWDTHLACVAGSLQAWLATRRA